MAQALPKTVHQWNVNATSGSDSLLFSEQPLPQVGDDEVLVKSK